MRIILICATHVYSTIAISKNQNHEENLNLNSLLVEKSLRFSNDQTEIEVHMSKYIRLPL